MPAIDNDKPSVQRAASAVREMIKADGKLWDDERAAIREFN